MFFGSWGSDPALDGQLTPDLIVLNSCFHCLPEPHGAKNQQAVTPLSAPKVLAEEAANARLLIDSQ